MSVCISLVLDLNDTSAHIFGRYFSPLTSRSNVIFPSGSNARSDLLPKSSYVITQQYSNVITCLQLCVEEPEKDREKETHFKANMHSL